MPLMKVGLVGCGNIGTDLCIAVQKGDIPAEIAALTDTVEENARRMKETFHLNADICGLDANAATVDYIVECASPSVVKEVVEAAIKHRRNCLVVSVGGLIANADLLEKAQNASIQVHIPSGALCGLDGINSAKEAGLDHVTLTTRKPPKGLVGAPYLTEHNISLENLTEPTVVFEGSAREAIKGFPKNVNVAAALSLKGIGPDRTRVRIVADPNSSANIHEIIAEGAFGRLQIVTENVPSPRNPKSSYLASLSACAELRAAAAAFVSHNPGH